MAVKNLTEEGFNVTGFDRNDYVGGLWHYTDEDKTSVLPSEWISDSITWRVPVINKTIATVINISKERVSSVQDSWR